MDERQQKMRAQIKRGTCNAFIISVLVLIFIDGFPFSPVPLRDLVDPALDKLGIYQGEWNMFAPEPDTVNTRLSADIEYYDGTLAHWSTPEWRKLSYFQRIMRFREHEYLEKASTLPYAQIWPELADFIVREQQGATPSESEVKRVKIYIENANIPDLRQPPENQGDESESEVTWHTWVEPPPFEDKNLLYERSYP